MALHLVSYDVAEKNREEYQELWAIRAIICLRRVAVWNTLSCYFSCLGIPEQVRSRSHSLRNIRAYTALMKEWQIQLVLFLLGFTFLITIAYVLYPLR